MEPVPWTMQEGAVALHEYFTSLLAVGFTVGQALYLVACMATGGPRPPA